MADELLKNVPPHNLEAERAVLGALMLDGGAADQVADAGTVAEDFYRPAHATIYGTVLDLRKRGEPVDTVSLVTELRRRGTLEAVGGPADVAALSSVVPTSANAVYYAKLVSDRALLRRTLRALAESQREVFESRDKTEELLDRVEKRVLAATQNGRRDKAAASLAELLALEFKEREAAKNGIQPGLLTGIRGLDELTHGLRPGDLAILAARPAMGKSTLAVNFLRNAALPCGGAQGRHVALISFEMPALEIVKNLLCLVARVDSHRLRGRLLDAHEERSLMDAGEVIEHAPIEILGAGDTAGFTVLDVRSRARRWKADGKLDLLIVDYLQLVRGSERRERSREQEVSGISRDLRALAAELDVPILALAQLNRNVEDRSDHRPRLSDLRESGSIEADASLVLLLHREAYYVPEDRAVEEGLANAAELLVAKNRYGPASRSVPLFYDARTGVFADGERPPQRTKARRGAHDHASAAAGADH